MCFSSFRRRFPIECNFSMPGEEIDDTGTTFQTNTALKANAFAERSDVYRIIVHTYDV